MKLDRDRCRVAIIGAGPAGIAAALQLKRFRVTVDLYDKVVSTSLLKNARLVENYLGFQPPRSGKELLQNFYIQKNSNKINELRGEIDRLTYEEDRGVFALQSGEHSFSADIVVVASGTLPRLHEAVIEGAMLEDLQDKICYEVLPLQEGCKKKVAIVGAGDAAFDYALSLLDKDNDVTLFNKSTEIKALGLLVDKAKAAAKFCYYDKSVLIKISPGHSNNLLLHFDSNTGQNSDEFDYLLLAIGRYPNKSFYSADLLRREEELMQKKLLYTIGDVSNSHYRQVALATADGIRVAMMIHEYILNN